LLLGLGAVMVRKRSDYVLEQMKPKYYVLRKKQFDMNQDEKCGLWELILRKQITKDSYLLKE